MHTALSDDGSLFGVFLYHPDPDGRAEMATALYKAGAQFTTYPSGSTPALFAGSVTLDGTNVTVIAGPLYVLGALDVSSATVQSAKQAVLYILHEPFTPGDLTERHLLAAALPLNILKGSRK